MAQGVLYIHSVSRALAPHIEWAASGVLGVPVRIRWYDQPAGPGLQRAEIAWSGRAAVGAELATALRGWNDLRYEITQEPTAIDTGSRWMYTPDLGIHHTAMDHEGNATLTEDRIRHCIALAGNRPHRIPDEIDRALGRDWDEELEHYRRAAIEESAPRRLHLVG
ncbi:DUF3145 family protein [Helcobacillus massiliensis]|uniref:DUF3145 family protein n=1 Tax=Helcobacillus massiliensis TaxID=521392 RepID=UPI00255315D3|nr:DUF3145 family protein [Helcobacillus massiliensis]MDK7741211.1 DUF3145 family protein [Helcobacillus massiliensis]WOO94017.1 DUF3145 family protein [Helcobacillus massiliensis]